MLVGLTNYTNIDKRMVKNYQQCTGLYDDGCLNCDSSANLVKTNDKIWVNSKPKCISQSGNRQLQEQINTFVGLSTDHLETVQGPPGVRDPRLKTSALHPYIYPNNTRNEHLKHVLFLAFIIKLTIF
ncbi:hypothetical protein RF11_13925 [Thelohanellus kitauei]|uniref:Uncharacterized protein n=1 Tax=Thelohanellus kitauei TaxID=669202 RepID=A0A0C2IVS5_THEKT|nr:hypothetical protein RF11_13925 [Thelohanellus kitauei]